MSTSTRKDSTVAAIVTCAIIFCCFSFLYIYCYQTPTLAYEQHVLSGGVTVYHPLVSAVIITVLGYILHAIVVGLTRLKGPSHALTYLPSMLCLALITCGHPDENGELTAGIWVWFIPLILLAYFAIIWVIRQWISNAPKYGNFFTSRTLIINLITMVVMMIFTCNIGYGDPVFHRQVKAEKLLIAQDYAALSHEGMNEEQTNATLTALHAIAMDKQHIIADSFFTQPVIGSEATLLRQEGLRPYLFSSHFMSRRKSFDYRLCAMLAQKDLDTFARVLSKHCNLNSINAHDSLPTHFKEALVLYQHQRSNPCTTYNDSVLEQDYADMHQMLRSCHTANERHLQLRQTYRNTYWYYYLTSAPSSAQR